MLGHDERMGNTAISHEQCTNSMKKTVTSHGHYMDNTVTFHGPYSDMDNTLKVHKKFGVWGVQTIILGTRFVEDTVYIQRTTNPDSHLSIY